MSFICAVCLIHAMCEDGAISNEANFYTHIYILQSPTGRQMIGRKLYCVCGPGFSPTVQWGRWTPHMELLFSLHGDVMIWRSFMHYLQFVSRILWPTVDSHFRKPVFRYKSLIFQPKKWIKQQSGQWFRTPWGLCEVRVMNRDLALLPKILKYCSILIFILHVVFYVLLYYTLICFHN